MNDSTANDGTLDADGSLGPGDSAPANEWCFDLDELLVSGNDVAYTDYARSAETGGPTENHPAIGADEIDAHAISRGEREPVIPGGNETVADGERDMDLSTTQNSTNIDPITTFQMDTLIFEEDALIG